MSKDLEEKQPKKYNKIYKREPWTLWEFMGALGAGASFVFGSLFLILTAFFPFVAPLVFGLILLSVGGIATFFLHSYHKRDPANKFSIFYNPDLKEADLLRLNNRVDDSIKKNISNPVLAFLEILLFGSLIWMPLLLFVVLIICSVLGTIPFSIGIMSILMLTGGFWLIIGGEFYESKKEERFGDLYDKIVNESSSNLTELKKENIEKIKNNRQETLLMVSCRDENLTVFDKLLPFWGDENIKIRYKKHPETYEILDTPLIFYAVQTGKLALVKRLLINKNLLLNHPNSDKNQEKILQEAASKIDENADICIVLLNYLKENLLKPLSSVEEVGKIIDINGFSLMKLLDELNTMYNIINSKKTSFDNADFPENKEAQKWKLIFKEFKEIGLWYIRKVRGEKSKSLLYEQNNKNLKKILNTVKGWEKSDKEYSNLILQSMQSLESLDKPSAPISSLSYNNLQLSPTVVQDKSIISL